MSYEASQPTRADITGRFTEIRHNLLETFMTRIRDENTPKREFAPLATKISEILAYEATRDLMCEHARVRTPTGAVYEGMSTGDHKQLLITIPRAGSIMLTPFLTALPSADGGYVNIRRDEETATPIVGEAKLPNDCSDYSNIFVLDPMLATGGSMKEAANLVLSRGAKPERITTVSVVAAPAGVLAVHSLSPQIEVITAALDPGLNSQAYIVPGLGDFGDRVFGNATSGMPTYS